MPSQKNKEKREDTVRRILDTAAEVFAAVGFGGARMDEIADRAGVNKATIYYHIGDKETLYTRVLHEHFASAGDGFDRILQQAASPEDKLAHYIQHLAQVTDANPHKAVIMLREIAAGGEHFPDILSRDLTVIIGKLMEILAEGEKQGRFIPVNPFSVHLMVIGAFVLYKASAPVRKRMVQISSSLEPQPADILGAFAGDIERLILRAVKTDLT
jgi:TetR/AcrR family transcriptional regulator